MMKKRITWIIIFSIVAFGFLYLRFSSDQGRESETLVEERVRRHQKDVARLNERLDIEKKAYQKERSGDYEGAIKFFEEVLTMEGDSSSSSPARLALVRIYEKTGQYKKALEQVDWFLKGNQNEQGRAETMEIRNRLLKKMQTREGARHGER